MGAAEAVGSKRRATKGWTGAGQCSRTPPGTRKPPGSPRTPDLPVAPASGRHFLPVQLARVVVHTVSSSRFTRLGALLVATLLATRCGSAAEQRDAAALADTTEISTAVEAAVWAFHAADTARDAEAIIRLLWPEFTMLADGARQGYDEVVDGSRQFMASLELFHTEWTDLRIVPLGPNTAVASFQFRDSIRTRAGALIRSRGPTTFVWERRSGEWRLRHADADHYPIEQ